MESAKQLLKKLIKTMVCKSFPFHYFFRFVKSAFTSCIATFGMTFHETPAIAKSAMFSTDSERLLKWPLGRTQSPRPRGSKPDERDAPKPDENIDIKADHAGLAAVAKTQQKSPSLA